MKKMPFRRVLNRSALKTTATGSMLAALAIVAGCSSTKEATPNNYVFLNGDIVTMTSDAYNASSEPEAVWVYDGKIKAVGSKDAVMKKVKEAKDANVVGDPEEVDLNGGTLMPGFIEPHTHLPFLIDFSVVADLSPCLPKRYSYRTYDDDKCPLNLEETWEVLNKSDKREIKPVNPKSKPWIIGNGIDPARFGNNNLESTRKFINNPAKAIEENVDGGTDNPVFLLDQSGHVAYVNRQAFVAAGICYENQPCNIKNANPDITLPQNETPALGTWVVDKEGNFTGKLLESPSYELFTKSVQKDLDIPRNGPFNFVSKEQGMEVAPKLIEKIAKTGVTTLVNAGGYTLGEVEFIKDLALGDANNGTLRFRTLISSDIVGRTESEPSVVTAKSLKTPYFWSNDNKGLYGAYGIKWWADGSTQGCSAGLNEDYAFDGLCEGTSGSHGMNYNPTQLTKTLKKFWGDGWLIQVHANGDKAMQDTLDAFATLQKGCELPVPLTRPNHLPIVIHHATVGGNAKNENVIKQIKAIRDNEVKCKIMLDGRSQTIKNKLDISVSHTAGHIAYWGGAFESILDGKGQSPSEDDSDGRTATLDPVKADIDNRVPVSLHSDAPVTPIHPLWYVEQVVTRNTWFYPKLEDKDAQPMPVNSQFGNQQVDVYSALRGITIVPAQQNMLADKIGTIEEGKVADLVILDKNPLSVDENKIHTIKVKATFVNGVEHNW